VSALTAMSAFRAGPATAASARAGKHRAVVESDWDRIQAMLAGPDEALLLGRRSDAWFEARWSGRTGAWADRLNGLPKYVVSSTTAPPRWSNATLLTGDVLAQIAKLKQGLRGDLLVYASCQLARSLVDHDLVDELRLVVFPVIVGDGTRLFGQTTAEKALRLLSARTLGEGLSFLTYAFVR